MSTFITQGKRSFFRKILLFFLPMVRLEISILGKGYGQNIEKAQRKVKNFLRKLKKANFRKIKLKSKNKS
ncbi:hypothetical protein JHK85_001199 [Glycine max]|nr:hypothetical protein JHK85_001199 [Glycine max]